MLGFGYRADDVCHAVRGGVPENPYEGFSGTSGVWLFDAASGAQTAALLPRGHDLISGVAFSPDGKHVAFASHVKAYVWGVAATKPAYEGSAGASAVNFARDGTLLVVRPPLGLAVVDWRNNADLRAFRLSDRRADEPLDSILQAPDRASALYTTLGGVVLLDLTLGRERQRFPLPKLAGINRVNAVALSPDGGTVLGCSGLYSLDNPAGVSEFARALVRHDAGRDVCLWSAHTGELLKSFAGHRKAVCGAVFVDEGRKVVSASTDGTLRLWDVPTP